MFIVELSLCGSVSVCRKNGRPISKRSNLGRDLLDCCASGDCEPAIRYVLEKYKPEFRIVRRVDSDYVNVLASAEEKRQVCNTIYWESESDFNVEHTAELYLLWQAASDFSSN
jgi:hypothetical protein